MPTMLKQYTSFYIFTKELKIKDGFLKKDNSFTRIFVEKLSKKNFPFQLAHDISELL